MSAKHEQTAETTRRHKRGYLPHYDSVSLTQFVTFRLADSLPRTFLSTLKTKLQNKQIGEIEYHRQIDLALDKGDGPTWLRDPIIANLVARAILHLCGKNYELIAWVIMPNHVHMLIKAAHLSQAMRALKGYTAFEANKILDRTGRFWSPDYFDRFIRDRRHFSHVLKYVDENPVKAGLARTPEAWPWGSAGWHKDSLR